jgi:hypothetical protein
MKGITPETAKAKWCPQRDDEVCGAESCMAWRWLPLTTSEPGYVEAVRDAVGTTPEGHSKPLTVHTAPKWVNENRAALSLIDKPYLGFCGMAGEPLA